MLLNTLLSLVAYQFSALAVVVILLPLVFATLMVCFYWLPVVRDFFMVLGSIILFAVILFLFLSWRNLDTLVLSSFVVSPFYDGLSIAFHMEPLTMLFMLLVGLLWMPTTLYSIGYMRTHHEDRQTKFYFYLHLAIVATFGIAFSANLLTFFLFYEMLTLSTIPLILHSRSREALANVRIYLSILIGTSMLLFLPSMFFLFYHTGTLDFIPNGILGSLLSPWTVTILFSVMILSIAKVGLMPFHRWLPAAMVAPTPVSSLLHAVAVVKSGAFGVLKISLYIFGLPTLQAFVQSSFIMYLACFTIVISGFIAVAQDNLKKRLAYSTITNLAYIVLSVSIFSTAGILAAVSHFFAHAFSKIALFYAAGSILVVSHRSDVSSMAGLGRSMPITFFAFTIGSLSLIGLPFFAGFISKFTIFLALLEDSRHIIPIVIFILSPILAALYYLPMVYRGYFMPSRHPIAHGEAPLLITIPLLFVCVLIIGFFFVHDWLFSLVYKLF